MTPEATDFLVKARSDLEDARKIMSLPLAAVAARSAYYAAFHAAEALIFERTGKIAKTHTGVRTEFARILKEVSKQDRSSLTFLVQAYKYKQVSDYGIGRMARIGDAEAWEAIVGAELFIARVQTWVEDKS